MSDYHRYLYVGWLRDDFFPPDDEDYEWPCCIYIVAENEERASEWGDKLCEEYASEMEYSFLKSYIDYDFHENISDTPVVYYGDEMSHEKIGWLNR